MVYLGEQNQIIKFDSENPQRSREVVIGDLPESLGNGENMHPLSQFVFMDDRSLLVNHGAPTDRCEEDAGKLCRSSEKEFHAALWQYKQDDLTGNWSGEVYVRGLRNSAALIKHSSGFIYQAENGHEISDKEENKRGPFEEFNQIFKGKHYGWPYCYNNFAVTPEWDGFNDFRCSLSNDSYQTPIALLPPHVSPLDMIYYQSDAIAGLEGKIIMSWHGWRGTGQRVVSYPVDEYGAVITEEVTPWFYKQNIGPARTEARAKGGK